MQALWEIMPRHGAVELGSACPVLVSTPASQHRGSREQAEAQSGREPARTNYLREGTFLKASFLRVVFSSGSSDAGLGVWKVSLLGPWPRLFSNTSTGMLLLHPEGAGEVPQSSCKLSAALSSRWPWPDHCIPCVVLETHSSSLSHHEPTETIHLLSLKS